MSEAGVAGGLRGGGAAAGGAVSDVRAVVVARVRAVVAG